MEGISINKTRTLEPRILHNGPLWRIRYRRGRRGPSFGKLSQPITLVRNVGQLSLLLPLQEKKLFLPWESSMRRIVRYRSTHQQSLFTFLLFVESRSSCRSIFFQFRPFSTGRIDFSHYRLESVWETNIRRGDDR